VKGRIVDYLELVRVFLTPTAIADSAAGFLAASAPESLAGPSILRLLGACLGSVAAYWLGMALNDLCDRAKDAQTAPQKPIPQGRVTARGAAVLCAALALAVLSTALALQTVWAALALLAAIAAYDGGAKRVPILGNLVMGGCRGLNFLWGAACAAGEGAVLGDVDMLLGSCLLALFVAGVTAVSRLEDAPFDAGRLTTRALPILAVPAVLGAAAWHEPMAILNALLLAVLLAGALRSALAAGASPGARFHGAQVYVRKALAGLFFVDAGLVAALLSGSEQAGVRRLSILALYGLFLWAWAWKRAWLRRGSAGS